ncbi:MAG: RNA polymerase sigma factor [Longimicrobiaceae bacterium]
MSAEHDRADAALAAAGDAEAFGRLYWRHAARVKALARRLLGPADADDGAQEVFVRAWSRLGQFRGEAAFGTWLHRLAVNVLVRQLHRQRRHAGEGDQALEHVAGPEARRPDADLERALRSLPEGLCEVVVLHDMEGYTHEEIAELLGIGVSASKMRLHRGRTALRPLVEGMRE